MVDRDHVAPVALDLRHQPPLRDIRRECVVCGVHVIGWRASALGAWCSNCGGRELRPVPAVKPRD